jgi:hypothetical protein
MLRNVARVDQWAALVISARALVCAVPLLVAGMFGACGSPYHLTPGGVNTTLRHGVHFARWPHLRAVAPIVGCMLLPSDGSDSADPLANSHNAPFSLPNPFGRACYRHHMGRPRCIRAVQPLHRIAIPRPLSPYFLRPLIVSSILQTFSQTNNVYGLSL